MIVRMLKLLFKPMLVVVRIFFIDCQNAGPNVQDSVIHFRMLVLLLRPLVITLMLLFWLCYYLLVYRYCY